ncbi:MAG TPA: GGDEF domain-containing phosphodiesterase, partial [Acidobacteriaceae bacterium]|nr:GGDEF domain-containing phosphodiesterase [Acidobacteriaceae bacterium]
AVAAAVRDAAAAADLGEKLRAIVSQPFAFDGRELQVTASVGITFYDGGELTAQELIRHAHVAMHHARSAGKSGSCFFSQAIQEHAHQTLELLHALRFAQERREFVLHYQPQVAARSGRIAGAEALPRWRHPDLGLIPPDRFIPLAERSGLIVPIGAWVLDEACRQLKEWHGADQNQWSMSVNLSTVQFNHPDLVSMIRETLNRHDLAPTRLTLEMTESTAMRDPDRSMVILSRLSEMGVRISIDDFGTGHSSFLYLKRFPAHEIKIDRGFVRDLIHDSEDAAIIAAIVALGRTLDLAIVAEGVETTSQRELLTDLGCQILQGYLLGPPVPADQFLRRFGTSAHNTGSASL